MSTNGNGMANGQTSILQYVASRAHSAESGWAMFVLSDKRDVKPLVVGLVQITPRCLK